MVVPLNISGLLSKVFRNHIGKIHTRLFLTTKVQISTKAFDLVNWEVIEESMKYLSFGTKLGAITFASQLCGTGKMMKIVGTWPSHLCTFFQEEIETTLRVKTFEHHDMLEIFEK